MDLYEAVEAAVTTRTAAENYGIEVRRNGIMNREIMEQIDKKSNEVIGLLHYDGGGLVRTDSIIQAVSKISKTSISFSYVSFDQTDVPDAKRVGAMMCVQKKAEGQPQTANIILNSDKDIRFRRFSLIHELGHLVTESYTIKEDGDEYMLSAHIRYDFTSFTEEECKRNPVPETEQQANIFALKVLMPQEELRKQVLSKESFLGIAEYFGVSKDAVRSRMLLGIWTDR